MLTLTLLLALQGPPADPAADSTATAPPAPASSEMAKSNSVPEADAVVEPEGWNPWVVGGVQVAAGYGTSCASGCLLFPVGIGLSFVPVVGPFLSSTISAVIGGVLIGGVDTWLGDRFGRQRAAMIWPILAAGGSLLVSGLAANLFALATTGSAGQTLAFENGTLVPKGATPDLTVTVIRTAIGLAGLAATIVAPAVVYAFTATDKGPGDEGQGFPGLLSPANPMPEASASTALPAAVAMHY